MDISNISDLNFFQVYNKSESKWKMVASFESSLSLRAAMQIFPDGEVSAIDVCHKDKGYKDTINFLINKEGVGLAETHRFYKDKDQFYEDYLIAKVAGLKQ